MKLISNAYTPSTKAIPERGKFDGVIPGWGTGDLVSLVIARVKTSQSRSYNMPFYSL
jgi:hypothetical protein